MNKTLQRALALAFATVIGGQSSFLPAYASSTSIEFDEEITISEATPFEVETSESYFPDEVSPHVTPLTPPCLDSELPSPIRDEDDDFTEEDTEKSEEITTAPTVEPIPEPSQEPSETPTPGCEKGMPCDYSLFPETPIDKSPLREPQVVFPPVGTEIDGSKQPAYSEQPEPVYEGPVAPPLTRERSAVVDKPVKPAKPVTSQEKPPISSDEDVLALRGNEHDPWPDKKPIEVVTQLFARVQEISSQLFRPLGLEDESIAEPLPIRPESLESQEPIPAPVTWAAAPARASALLADQPAIFAEPEPATSVEVPIEDNVYPYRNTGESTTLSPTIAMAALGLVGLCLISGVVFTIVSSMTSRKN